MKIRSCLRKSLVMAWPIVVLSICSLDARVSRADADDPVADQWANLAGSFVYDGPRPAPVQRFVNNRQPIDESLVVGATGGLANVIIYVRSANVKVHPDLANPSGVVVLEHKNFRFEPHVVAIQVGQTLRIKNSDPFGLNANLQPLGDQGTNPLIAGGATHAYQFHRKQNLPVPVNCSIHPWLRAYMLPRDNPYTAVTDADGNFTIKNLPAGEKLEFQVWQEKAGYLSPEGTQWVKGRFERTLMPGENTLGVIKVKPAAFERK